MLILRKTSSYIFSNSSCTVTSYDDVPWAVSNCLSINLNNLTVPASKSLDLSKLKPGTNVTFSGNTVCSLLTLLLHISSRSSNC